MLFVIIIGDVYAWAPYVSLYVAFRVFFVGG